MIGELAVTISPYKQTGIVGRRVGVLFFKFLIKTILDCHPSVVESIKTLICNLKCTIIHRKTRNHKLLLDNLMCYKL